MWSTEQERQVHEAALTWLAVRTNDGRDAITREELREFEFGGERIPLIDRGRGIRKPRSGRAALSIMTVHTPEGRRRPYEDVEGRDGFPRYKMRRDNASENEGVRQAMVANLPIIWLIGVAPALFQAIFPVYVVDHEPAQSQFVLSYDRLQRPALDPSPAEEIMRRWVHGETRVRLHQRVFRSMVMAAYETRCSVCSLSHSELLDAAHIIEDRDERGVAAVRNGLALCKIHHAAYDHNILGISPDLHVAIRNDILAEVDGPLFEHGIKGLHGNRLLIVPSRRNHRPDTEMLELRYRRFLAA